MNIIRKGVPAETFERFVTAHDFIVVVTRRDRSSADDAGYGFYAFLDGIEISEGSLLRSAVGNGNSEEEAIRDLVEILSGHRLVYHAMEADRKTLQAPWFEEET